MNLNSNYTKYGGMLVNKLPLSDLHYFADVPEDKSFYESLSKNIKNNGMMDPVLVVPVTAQRLKYIKSSYPYITESGNDITNLVITGNNRVYYAYKNNYTSIDAVVVSTNDFVQVARVKKKAKEETNNVLRNDR